ncbi:hypothetical protein LguiA_012549 [Lonicera macranthoides]
MELDCLIAYGTSLLIYELLMPSSDPFEVQVLRLEFDQLSVQTLLLTLYTICFGISMLCYSRASFDSALIREANTENLSPPFPSLENYKSSAKGTLWMFNLAVELLKGTTGKCLWWRARGLAECMSWSQVTQRAQVGLVSDSWRLLADLAHGHCWRVVRGENEKMVKDAPRGQEERIEMRNFVYCQLGLIS